MAWECGCGVENGDFKDQCRACGTPKDVGEYKGPPPPVARPMMWECGCGEVNQDTRAMCSACGKPRGQGKNKFAWQTERTSWGASGLSHEQSGRATGRAPLIVYFFLAMIPIGAIGIVVEFSYALICTVRAGVIPSCGNLWKNVAAEIGYLAICYLFTVHYCLRLSGDKWFGHIREVEKAVWAYVKETLRRGKRNRGLTTGPKPTQPK